MDKNIVDDELDRDIDALQEAAEDIRNKRNYIAQGKNNQLEQISNEIMHLIEIKKDRIFYDIWANNIYFEYGAAENLSLGFSFFSQAKNLQTQQHYCAFFSQMNFMNNERHIVSGSLKISVARDFELSAGLSYGRSWKIKKLRCFSSLEPIVTFSKNKAVRFSLDVTNGMHFDHNISSISQSIYERNLETENPKYQHIFREKCSLIKQFETSIGLISLEVGFFTNAYFRKHKDMEKGLLLGLWFQG